MIPDCVKYCPVINIMLHYSSSFILLASHYLNDLEFQLDIGLCNKIKSCASSNFTNISSFQNIINAFFPFFIFKFEKLSNMYFHKSHLLLLQQHDLVSFSVA